MLRFCEAVLISITAEIVVCGLLLIIKAHGRAPKSALLG